MTGETEVKKLCLIGGVLIGLNFWGDDSAIGGNSKVTSHPLSVGHM